MSSSDLPPEARQHLPALLRGLRVEPWRKPVNTESLRALVSECQRMAVRQFALSRKITPYFFVLATHADGAWKTTKYAAQLPLLVKVPFLEDASKENMFATVREFASSWGGAAVLTVAEGLVTWTSTTSEFSASAPAREVVYVICQSLVTTPPRLAFHALIHRPRKARPYLGPWLGALGVRSAFAPLPIAADPSIPANGVLDGALFDLLPVLSKPLQ